MRSLHHMPCKLRQAIMYSIHTQLSRVPAWQLPDRGTHPYEVKWRPPLVCRVSLPRITPSPSCVTFGTSIALLRAVHQVYWTSSDDGYAFSFADTLQARIDPNSEAFTSFHNVHAVNALIRKTRPVGKVLIPAASRSLQQALVPWASSAGAGDGRLLWLVEL